MTDNTVPQVEFREAPLLPSPMPGEDVVDIDDFEPGEEMPTAPLPDIDDQTPSEVQ